MSARPDPESSGAVEIATRRCPRLRVVQDLLELTHDVLPLPITVTAKLDDLLLTDTLPVPYTHRKVLLHYQVYLLLAV